ncbi:MAG: hypothetical protein HKN73_08955 [Gemmatimonadetes bacterium]|nr:hypothetical protein [Gemmatimonadota bacterium]
MIEERVDPINIDVGELVQRTVASLYANLVTRPTGRAVRQAIEQQLQGDRRMAVSLIDFTEVRILDFSCADEVVAKLVARYLDPDRPREAFFLFRAVEELHSHTVEEVLRRQSLAAVCDVGAGYFQLLGEVEARERDAWQRIERAGRLVPRDAEQALGKGWIEPARNLATRRLVFMGPGGDITALSAMV